MHGSKGPRVKRSKIPGSCAAQSRVALTLLYEFSQKLSNWRINLGRPDAEPQRGATLHQPSSPNCNAM
jgi:hypothetical protein